MKVIMTNTAIVDYFQIIDYIVAKFSLKTGEEFKIKMDFVVANVVKFNEIGQVYQKTEYRYILISEQTYLFYRLETNKIYIVKLWLTFQDPQKLKTIFGD